MSNLYTTTARIHELLPKINQKYCLKIEVESDYYFITKQKSEFEEYKKEVVFIHKSQLSIYEDGSFHYRPNPNLKTFLKVPAIQAPQIRQILVGLHDVLGVLPSRKIKEGLKERGFGDGLFGMLNSWGFGKASARDNRKARKIIYARIDKGDLELKKLLDDYDNTISVEILSKKWLDGLNPLFDQNPEQVLTELLEILENLLK